MGTSYGTAQKYSHCCVSREHKIAQTVSATLAHVRVLSGEETAGEREHGRGTSASLCNRHALFCCVSVPSYPSHATSVRACVLVYVCVLVCVLVCVCA